MKYFDSNAECIHAYVHATHAAGKCGNTRFEGPLFWSYRTAIARLEQQTLFLMSTWLSTTTARHAAGICSAARGVWRVVQTPTPLRPLSPASAAHLVDRAVQHLLAAGNPRRKQRNQMQSLREARGVADDLWHLWHLQGFLCDADTVAAAEKLFAFFSLDGSPAAPFSIDAMPTAAFTPRHVETLLQVCAVAALDAQSLNSQN